MPIPQLLERVADAADAALEALSKWDLKLGDNSRLHQASALLRQTSERREVLPTSTAVLPVLRALWVASDFTDIAEYLPANRVKTIRDELIVALRGPLWPDAGSRQPLQYQTQHWIGAVLVHAGVDIQHVPLSETKLGKTPEFWIPHGTFPTGVEVKRPESIARIAPTMSEAMQKFESRECHAALVVELSDCLQAGPEATMRADAQRLMGIVHQTVWDDSRGELRPSFRKLIYVGGVFRGAWEVPPEDSTRLRLFGHALHQGYTRHPRSLHGIRSDWMQRSFNSAFSSVVERIATLASRPVA